MKADYWAAILDENNPADRSAARLSPIALLPDLNPYDMDHPGTWPHLLRELWRKRVARRGRSLVWRVCQ